MTEVIPCTKFHHAPLGMHNIKTTYKNYLTISYHHKA